MSGNIWEWCGDIYGAGYYKENPANNPQGPTKAGNMVLVEGGTFSMGSNDGGSGERPSHSVLLYV